MVPAVVRNEHLKCCSLNPLITGNRIRPWNSATDDINCTRRLKGFHCQDRKICHRNMKIEVWTHGSFLRCGKTGCLKQKMVENTRTLRKYTKLAKYDHILLKQSWYKQKILTTIRFKSYGIVGAKRINQLGSTVWHPDYFRIYFRVNVNDAETPFSDETRTTSFTHFFRGKRIARFWCRRNEGTTQIHAQCAENRTCH